MSQQYPPHQPPPHPAAPGPYGPPRKRFSTGAVIAMVVGGVFVLLVALGLAVGDETPTDDKAGKPPAAAESTAAKTPAPEPTTAAPTSTAPEKKAESGTLPNFVGMGLQSAQDKAQEVGFHHLASHDALGRGRNQVSDRNWKVCSQTPAPGRHPSDTKVDFGTVKLEEDCPATDAGAVPESAGSTMPDFKGKSVKVARQTLDSSTSFTIEDASGADRFILVESNWKICSQEPAAGTALNGQPVTLRAVKFEESCS
ncbi:hypothetical protein [Streptomyces cinereoruber]|uniref:hypothetical protein n=1 Tax=Streptomyces cinereoruber TaxID=67260 RepID=UPI00363BC81F